MLLEISDVIHHHTKPDMLLNDAYTHIIEPIEAMARQYPDRTALLHNDESISYKNLMSLVNALALQLLEQGIGKGCAVAICMERSAAMLVGVLGIIKSGAAYIPLDPAYPEKRIQTILDETRAFLLYSPTIENEVQKIAGLANPTKILVTQMAHHCTFQLRKRLDEGHIKYRIAPNTAYIIYTSGSTGIPKGVIIAHSNLIHAVREWLRYFQDPIGTFILLPSIAFDSSVMAIFWTLTSGGCLLIPQQNEEKEPEKIKQLIAKHAVTHTLCLPTLYRLLLSNRNDSLLRSLKVVLVAGEVCAPDLVAKHYSLLPNCKLYNGYGPTEITVHATTFLIPPYYKGDSIPIGKPLTGTFIYLFDNKQNIVADGEVGEIYIGGKGIAQGYWLNPTMTAERFIDNPFANGKLYRTGDMARYQPDGNLIFVGRNDRQIKLRGYRIELDEIENKLLQSDNVKEVAVICIENENIDKRIAAFVVYNDAIVGNTHTYNAFIQDNDAANVRLIKNELALHLPAYMIPEVWLYINKLPLSPVGKIDRKALEQLYFEAITNQKTKELPINTPRTALEKYLVQLWQEILKVDTIDIHDKFFEIGGNSVLAAQFTARIQHLVQETVFIVTLFDNPTIAQYAHFLEQEYGFNTDLKFQQNTANNNTQQQVNNIDAPSVEYNILSGEIDALNMDKNTSYIDADMPSMERNNLFIDNDIQSIEEDTSDIKKESHTIAVNNISIDKDIPHIDTHEPNNNANMPSLAPYLPYDNSLNRTVKGDKQDKIIFILAPPRSGTSLLSLMLANHPMLCAANELQLLHFDNLQDRLSAFEGKFSLWLDGTRRFLMNIENYDNITAQAVMQYYEMEQMNTAQFYKKLQQLVGNKILVDKTPSYALDYAALQYAEQIFDNAIYIHLVRNPQAVVYSFEKQRMAQAMYINPHPFSPKELGELVWKESHQNITRFLQNIPQQRQFTMCYEDLVTQTESVISALCRQINVPFHPNLLQPYQNMAVNKLSASHDFANAMTDPKLLEETAINPALADAWKKNVPNNTLHQETNALYAQLVQLKNDFSALNQASITPLNQPIVVHQNEPITNHLHTLPNNEQTRTTNERTLPNNEQTRTTNEHTLPNNEQTTTINERALPNNEQIRTKNEPIKPVLSNKNFKEEAILLNNEAIAINEIAIALNDNALKLNNEAKKINDEAIVLNNEVRMLSKNNKDLNEESIRLNEEENKLHQIEIKLNEEAIKLNNHAIALNMETKKLNDDSIRLNKEIKILNEEAKVLNEEAKALSEYNIKLNLEAKKLNDEAIQLNNSAIQLNLEAKRLNEEAIRLNEEIMRLNDCRLPLVVPSKMDFNNDFW